MPEAASGQTRSVIRVAAVDDHALVLAGLRAVLADPQHGIELVAAGSSVHEVVLPRHRIDVVLLDVRMDRADDEDVASDVRTCLAAGAVVVVHTAQDQPVVVRQAVRAGASGLVLKTDSPEHLAQVIRSVHDGDFACSSEVAAGLIGDPHLVTSFTPREVDVLRLISGGATHRMVAKELGIGERAVKEYLNRAVARLRAKGIEPGNAHGVVKIARTEGHLD